MRIKRNRIISRKLAIGLMIAALLCPIFPIGLTPVSYAESDGDFGYTVVNSTEATLNSYSGSDVDLVIPEKVGGVYDVTSIASSTFYSKGLTSVILPDTLTSIGTNAFYGNQLTTIDLPDSLTTIGAGAFQNNNLTNVVIPENISYLHEDVFNNNINLKSVTLPTGLTSIAARAFQYAGLETIELPNGLQTIGPRAFERNNIETLVIPDSVTSVGHHAFRMNNLSSVTLSSQMTEIEEYTFDRNSNLNHIDIPEGITTIGNNAFEQDWISEIVLPRSVSLVENDAFKMSYINRATILNDSAVLKVYAFGDSYNLTIVGYPGSTAETRANNMGYTFERYGKALFEGLDAANARLLNYSAGDAVGQVPAVARDQLTDAIDEAQTVADAIKVTDPEPLADATDALISAIAAFDAQIVPLSIAVPADGTYGRDDVLAFTVTYADEVTVTGDPVIELEIGNGGSTQSVEAGYSGARGTGLQELTFEYKVAAGLLDEDGIGVDNKITLPGGATITASDSSPATIAYTVPSTTGVQIDSGPTDAEAVADDKAALGITYAQGDSASSVTQEVELPTSGASGTTITWSSSNDAVVDTDGVVTRPAYTESDASVTLTATISKGSESDTQLFTLTVIPQAQTDAEAVVDDKAALAIAYAQGDSASSVTQDVELPTSGASGTTITWSSSNDAVVDTDGVVTRPAYTESDASVTLTATISKGSESDTQLFTLTVIPQAQTDAEAVVDDKAALAIAYAQGDSASSVTQDVELPTSGASGTTITWSSSNDAVVDTDGVVTRPAYTESDESVTLTATISKGSESDTQTFTLMVIPQAQTDAEAVVDDKAALAIEYASGDSASSVTQDVELPTSGASGTTIKWSSSNDAVVDTDGTVTRPAYTESDESVTLTATISKGSESDTQVFTLTVIMQAQTDAEAVADDKAALGIEYASGDSASSVTQNVELPTSGASGTTITWSSSNDAVVDTDGVVTRPAYTESDASVTLTAMISKGAESDTQVFTLTVIKQAQTDAEAVADDKAALGIAFAQVDSATNVTQDVELPTSGASGTTITWSSSNDAVVNTDGMVTRPTYTESDASVTLTATISKGSESDTQVFTLTVIKQVQTDAEAVADDKAALIITYAQGDSASSVTQNVELPTSGASGTTITWSSSNEAVVDTDGAVTRPEYTESDASVTLTATISKGSESDTQVFTLTVIMQAQTDAEAVADDKAALEIAYAQGDSASSVTQNVELPTSGASGTTITWSSSNDAVVDTDGVVTRPAYTESDASVTLTATISKGAESDTQTFTLTVIKQAQTDAEAVADDKAALAIAYASGDNASSVTEDVELPTSGASGTTITWSSSNDAVVDTDGKVTRPAYTESDASVTLTATISKGAESDTQTFTLTIIKQAQTDAEAVADDKAALIITYASGDSASSVTQNVELPTSGASGTTITWSSSNDAVVDTNGTVTRPAYTESDASVTLTATISKGAEQVIKEFVVSVAALPSTPSPPAVEDDSDDSDQTEQEENQVVEFNIAGSNFTNIAALEILQQDGQTLYLIRVIDENKFEAMLNNLPDQASIQIDVRDLALSGNLAVQWSGKIAKLMADKGIELIVKAPDAALQLGMNSLQLPDMQAEEQDEPKAQLRIEIGALTADEAKILDGKLPGQQIGELVRISVSLLERENQFRLTDWSTYGVLSMPLAEGTAGGLTPTMVWIGEDGTVIPLPTRSESLRFAQAHSIRDGIFALITYTPSFDDIEGRWSEADVEDMASRLIIQGVSTEEFDPQRSITRAELTALLVRALGLHTIESDQRFTDVSGDVWYADEVAAALATGLVTGDPDGSFRPNTPLTRQEAAVMLWRALSLTGTESAQTDQQVRSQLSNWNDAEQIAPWAREAMAMLHASEILFGDDSSAVRPDAELTREETAALLRRVLQTTGWID
ncbi:immunoglobulin-like domain-containing protein [Paenibacillus sp. HB172176]|uniref:immunoglobulin-like domain-containing protein n=1 Tax=Paenibacillus sp. HB172176 TaxID=2493690 RepID=UPI001439BDC9|nr:immunoglobulin-like domain-containing protein [Paenibacillus sp. HB172176]